MTRRVSKVIRNPSKETREIFAVFAKMIEAKKAMKSLDVKYVHGIGIVETWETNPEVEALEAYVEALRKKYNVGQDHIR